MKKSILSFVLTLALIISSMPLFAFATENNVSNAEESSSNTTNNSEFNLYVEKNVIAGLEGPVNIEFTEIGDNTYTGMLYLPGCANLTELKLSWMPNSLPVSVNGVSYESGNAPIPGKGATFDYIVNIGNQVKTYSITTLTGSENVQAMFINVDESMGTIEAMNNDETKETQCFGSMLINNKEMYMSMKGRGNTSWKFIKKPYNITIYKDETYDKKDSVKLIDGVKSKKWSILANANDPTCLRNKIGYDIADKLGIGLPSENIDIWMNGKYLGNYLLTPKNDYKSPDNGFMVEIEKDETADQFVVSFIKFAVKEKGDDVKFGDIERVVKRAVNAINNTKSEEYQKYIDIDSWAKMYLLNELYKDNDADSGSKFFTKESMNDVDKLVAGPVWDLDGTMGRKNNTYLRANYDTEQSGKGWHIDGIGSLSITSFFQRLGQHESFMKRVYEKYNEYISEFDKTGNSGIIDDLTEQIEKIIESAEMNYIKWHEKIYNQQNFAISEDNTVFGSGKYAVSYTKTDTWSAYVQNLREYLKKRLLFLYDNLFVSMPESCSVLGECNVDAGERVLLTVNSQAESYQWQESVDGVNWEDISGAIGNTFDSTADLSMNSKQYRCVLRNEGKLIETSKVATTNAGACFVTDPVTVEVWHEEHIFNQCVEADKYLRTRADCEHAAVYYKSCVCGESSKGTGQNAIFEGEALGHRLVNDITKATFEKDGNIKEYCENCGKTFGNSVIEKVVNPEISETIFTYNGEEIIPTVNIPGMELGTDYAVSSIDDKKNVGTHTVVVTLNGEKYRGTKELNYIINPNGTRLKTLTKAKKALTVRWSKQSTMMSVSRITGYQIQYSKSSTFESGNKIKNIDNYNKTSKKISKLKAKTKYYVRIRTYMNVDGNTYYSDWSKKKSIRTK